MTSVHSVDLSTVLLLAVVLWLDGWRRMPHGALLLRRMGPGAWRVAEPWARIGPFALTGLWSPLGMPLVVVQEDAGGDAARGTVRRWTLDFAVAIARARRRLRRSSLQVAALRVVGVLLIAWIIAGIPLATARSGLRGLLLGIVGAFCLAAWLAIVTAGALRDLGAGWRVAFRVSAPLLSPFSAMRAAEVVTEAALGSVPTLARVAALLGEGEFSGWLRPHAYDAVHSRADAQSRAAVASAVAALPRDVLAAALAVPAAEAGEDAVGTYCPRCATGYERAATTCSSCAGVALAER